MKSKVGSISIEAVISLSALILFFSFLVQALLLYAFHDQTTQRIYDEIDKVANYHYIYESIGPLDLTVYPWLESKIPDEIKPLIYESLDLIRDPSKVAFLRGILNNKIEKILHPKIRKLRLIDFNLEDQYLSVKVSFIQDLPFGFEIPGYVHVEKQLWFLGSHPELIDIKNLSSILKDTHESHSDTFVYMTKTGSKYHLVDCFYITRSTTDKKAIKKISLEQAEGVYQLAPCSRCILKGWTLWN